MSDIFLSYASQDLARARPLAEALETRGWTVFWDRTIPTGKNWWQVIGQELKDARCVVVLWSEAAIESTWVYEEADDGRKRGILIPVFIERADPPIGFRGMQAANLTDWDGSDGFPAYRRMITDIDAILRPPPAEAEEQAKRESEEEEARRKTQAEAEAKRELEQEAARNRAAVEIIRKRQAELLNGQKGLKPAPKAEEEAEAKRKTEAEKPSPEVPAAPPIAKPSKAPWIAVGAGVVVLGIGLAVYQPWRPSQPDPPRVEVEKPAPVEESPPEPAVTTPREPVVEALDAEMVALGKVNVREGPGMEHGKVTTLSRGVSVKVTGHVEDWYRVALDGGQEGYVFKELLSESKPEAATDVAAGAPKTLQPGETFRDCDACREMVVVPAGSFLMGSPDSDTDASDDEKPQHRVTIPKPFAVGVYEVTRGEYGRFVESTNHVSDGGCTVWSGITWTTDKSRSWRDPGFAQTDADPVACVNWDDARAYVKWLSGKTGKDYRLLTEAEWEYVARAGMKTRYSFGDTITHKDANFDRNVGKTSEVGSYPANPWGLYDMHGNVWEWVADCYEGDAYKTHKSYPAMVGSWQDSCGRVLRGGSWLNDPRGLRSANRSRNYPDYRTAAAGSALPGPFSPLG